MLAKNVEFVVAGFRFLKIKASKPMKYACQLLAK